MLDLVHLGSVLFWGGLLGFGVWCVVQTRKEGDKIRRALKGEPQRRDWTDEEAYLDGPSADQLRRELELLDRLRK